MKIVFALLASLMSSTAVAASKPGTTSAAAIKLVEFVKDLSRPVKMVARGEQLWVAEQAGKLRLIENGKLRDDPILDITDRLTEIGGIGDERGLLGLAIHPKDPTRVFLNYTTREPLRTRVSEFGSDLRTSRVNPASERIILEFSQPYPNHNGGEIAFGSDGLLYIATGDGGSGGDPQGHGQNLKSLLGKILRIDVDAGKPYAIPLGNPFRSQQDALPEIYAYGLRNPWRFSFDRVTGKLWAADVGQNSHEEVNVIEAGKNYGWATMEGRHCFRNASCSSAGLEMPVHEYGRSEGGSISGGMVYRGTGIPSLVGKYIFGDYVSGKIWALSSDGQGPAKSQWLMDSGKSIAAFGEDADGELYVLDLGGSLFRIAAK